MGAAGVVNPENSVGYIARIHGAAEAIYRSVSNYHDQLDGMSMRMALLATARK